MLQVRMSSTSQEKSREVFMYMNSVIGVRWDLETTSQGMACARGAREHACLHRYCTILQ